MRRSPSSSSTKLNDQLFDSANKANKYANILMPANAQIGNISYVLVAVVGGLLALNGIGGFTLGGLASFSFNRSFTMPINQVSLGELYRWLWPEQTVFRAAG